jgi:hypothetical protein
MNIQAIHDYAKLATLAYVDLSAESSPKIPDTIFGLPKSYDTHGSG